MYYDEICQGEYYQITFLEGADRDYYNCVHNFTKTDEKLLNKIEQYFLDKNVDASIYIDPNSPKDMQHWLESHNYKEMKEEEEIWYVFDLQKDSIPHEEKFLKISHEEVDFKILSKKDNEEILRFSKVNSSVNNLSDSLRKKFIQNVKNKDLQGVENHLLALFSQNELVAISSCGWHEKRGYLAEGGVTENYRRKGLYSYLIIKCLQMCKKNGCNQVFINCDIQAYSNEVVRKIGFKKAFHRSLYKKKITSESSEVKGAI